MAASEAIKGVYEIWRDKSSKKGKQFFHIEGWKEDGARVRKRRDTEEEAKVFKKECEDEDKIFQDARLVGSIVVTKGNRSVWSSDLITSQARVFDCEEALRLFPKSADGTPDMRFSVKDAVMAGLQVGGYNPVLPTVTVTGVLPVYMRHIAWRAKLPKTNQQHLGTGIMKNYPYFRRSTEKMFGEMLLSQLAADGILKKSLNASSLSINPQQKIASFVNGLMEWAMIDNTTPIGENPAPAHPRYIGAYTTYFPRYKKKTENAVMSVTEVQVQVDSAWDLSMKYRGPRAARTTVLIFCSLRPSEVDHPDFSISEDCKVARVPDDTKTGWRFVAIPPNAQIMLRVLKEQGLLIFTKESATTLGKWRGQLGYHVSDTQMRGWLAKQLRIPYKEVKLEYAKRLFREKYPYRPEFGRNVADKSRHTGGSFYLTACQNIEATATYMGNSAKTVKRYYWGKVQMDQVALFYRIIPKALKMAHDPAKIDLPYWFDLQHAEAAKAEAVKVEQAAAELTAHLSTQQAARAEARRQMLNGINRRCRARRGAQWEAKRRENYAKDEVLRETIKQRNRDGHALHKDERNAGRRERYANDSEYRQKILQQQSKAQRNK